MRVERIEPPRRFGVGGEELTHVADVTLDEDELITLAPGYDVTRKPWGFYATPSLNGRARDHGLRAALCRNADGRAFLLLVEAGREADFEAYLGGQGMRVLTWLDGDAAVERLADVLEG